MEVAFITTRDAAPRRLIVARCRTSRYGWRVGTLRRIGGRGLRPGARREARDDLHIAVRNFVQLVSRGGFSAQRAHEGGSAGRLCHARLEST